MAGLYPLSRQQQSDSNGNLLGGSRLFLFDGGTSTPRIGYRDLALTTPHPNPIVADAAGRLPLIYLDDGYYRQRLTSATGTLIFDDDGIPVLTSSSGGAGTSVDPDSVFKTRDIKIRFDDQPLAGYVRMNGRSIGSASSGATERANADTQSLFEELWGFSNIGVSGGKGASAAADFAANKTLTLPSMAGRVLAGMDDLGAGPQSILTTAVLGSDPTLPGSAGGAQTVTIDSTKLPVSSPWTATASGNGTTSLGGGHSHSTPGSTTGGVSATHTHGTTILKQAIQQGGGAGVTVYTPSGGAGSDSLTSGTESADHTHAVPSGTSGSVADHNHPFSFSGNVAFGNNSGGGQPTNKLPPLMTFMIYIRL